MAKSSLVVLIFALCELFNISTSWKRLFGKSSAILSGIVISQLTVLPTHAMIDPASIERFEAARVEFIKLDKNWDTIVLKQGDNVRRKLGTVYTPVNYVFTFEEIYLNYHTHCSLFVQAHYAAFLYL